MSSRIFLFVFLFLPSTLSAPTGRTNQTIANSSNSTQTVAPKSECYFSEVRKSPLETNDRPEKSVVSTTCEGETQTFGDLMKYQDDVSNTDHILAILLCRGSGNCDLDFENPSVMNQWKDKKICDHHKNELLLKWDKEPGFRDDHTFRGKTRSGRGFVCSMPATLGVHHTTKPEMHTRLTVNEASAILKEHHVLVHPGIPICSKHQTFIDQLVSKSPTPKRSKLMSSHDSENQCAADPPYTYQIPQKRPQLTKSFLKFASDAGVPRVCPRKLWTELEETTKERKVSAARKLIESMLGLMVSGETDEFRQRVEHKFVQLSMWTSGASEELDAIMNQIAAQYFASEDRNNRILILSLVANSVSYLKVEKYIPGLSGYMYDKAKKFARRKRTTQLPSKDDDDKKVKYDPAAVEPFIEFITRLANCLISNSNPDFSPTVMIGLPYGIRKVKMSDGSKKEIPNSIRQQSATEIIEMYTKVHEETGSKSPMLGVSTMYKILKACAATKRESTTCVDYFIAEGQESFDGLHEILDKWRDMALFDSEVMKQMQHSLLEAAQYLRTDYRLHVKSFSRIADHCASYALSDPNDPEQAVSCSNKKNEHTHDLKCERCESLDFILDKIETHAKEFVAEEEEELLKNPGADKSLLEQHQEEVELIKKYKSGIFEMKKHLLRAAVSNEERRKLIAQLKDNEALLTLDFAQKFLPKWHREKQSDYFGKKGISYHIAHVTARIGQTFAQHSFVHIYEGSVVQDSNCVVITIQHFLTELKKAGIVKVHLRSDNAGAYHCASTIGSLHYLMETTGMKIGSYSFSEAQNGKSSSDRDANRVKRRVKEYINQNHDVTTSLEFFNALKANPPNGISVYHGSFTTTDQGGSSWKGISNLNFFTVESNGIRGRRYDQIGKGMFVNKNSFKPIKGVANFEGAGFLASNIDSEEKRKTEREAVEKGTQTSFWYHPNCATSSNCVKETDTKPVVVDDYVPSNVIGDLFTCPEKGCSGTFLKFSNLEKHIIRGQHSIAPEKLTMRDYALNFFSRKLEDVNAGGTCAIVGTAVKQMKETVPKNILSPGWALPTKKTRKPFAKDVIQFLLKCFDQGVTNKKPMNPVVVAKMMRTAKNKDGTKTFKVEDQLESRQIASFFSREADKRRHLPQGQPAAQQSHRRRRHHGHRRHLSFFQRRRRTNPQSVQPVVETYVEPEEEHEDSGWIQFMKSVEFWNLFDEFLDATINNEEDIFS